MAIELAAVLANTDDPVIWDAELYHVCCYAHKLGLVVKEGLKFLGIKTSKSKPSIPNNMPMPIPIIRVESAKDDDKDQYISYEDDYDLDPQAYHQ